jgi:hypothetical protein
MNNIFKGPAAGELHGFLQFKRSLGYGYMRAEFTLREFDRFLIEYAARNRRWQLDRAAIAWLSSKPGRKPISVSGMPRFSGSSTVTCADHPSQEPLLNRSGHACLQSPPLFRILFRKSTFCISWRSALISSDRHSEPHFTGH